MANEPPEDAPVLMNAQKLEESDVGTCDWDRELNGDALGFSEDGRTVSWKPRKRSWKELVPPPFGRRYRPPAWIPASTRLHLHSGTFRWDFEVAEMAHAQIGVGFMLLWSSGAHVGPSWGLFGYLGSSSSAWAYDPLSGDVVSDTKSIEGGLPKFADGQSGVVSVRLHLPRFGPGTGVFVVNGASSRLIHLPESAVILPAACLLHPGQHVTLANFKRS